VADKGTLNRLWAVRAGALAGGLLAGLLVSTIAQAAPSGWLAIDGSIRFNGGAATRDWANSGGGSPTYSCSVGSVNLSGPGGVFNCGRPGGVGSPPIAPSLTPAAAADPSIISSDFIVDPISTDTTACGLGDPTTFSGAATNGAAISSYTFNTGTVPNKDDLSNVYAVSHTRADNGHPELYFAAERLVNNGDSHIDFEFLQTQIALTGTCSGSFTGHRTEGDLLVAVDFTNGGALAGTSVYQWHCVAEPGPQPADGTVCDPSGATPPQHYQLINVPSSLSFLVNAADIPCGGWVCRDKISGNSTVVSTNDFLEGGIDLMSIPFTGCFNSFLPHTRTSQPISAVLKDFAGPVALRSCRNPALASSSAPGGSTVAPGTAATDSVTVGNGGAGLVPTGTVTFFLCSPAQITAGGCVSGGAQVGSAKPLVAGAATSDPTSATNSLGKYCWRTEYTPDVAAAGVYSAATHTNATTECFLVAAAAPGLPNTGAPISVPQPSPPAAVVLMFPVLLLAVAWRRSRTLAALLVGGLIAGSSPSPGAPVQAPPIAAASATAIADHSLHRDRANLPPNGTPSQPTRTPAPQGWRLVIAKIGVDAPIQKVGLDRQNAMAAPGGLGEVGWYDRGPLPGQTGDAVIAGHYGLPSDPAVFRNLRLLRPGDFIQVLWPDGRRLQFRVTATALVSSDSPAPPDVFARSGSPRLSLITCAGAWEQSRRTYGQRLIVTADLASWLA
jgi:LPXTG-site transpeptidase (sortase) family protein